MAPRYARTRKLSAETLESRRLLAADTSHNFLHPVDVNDDSVVSPMDALLVINTLNSTVRGQEVPNGSRPFFHDVNDDSLITPIDALMIVNRLNSRSNAGELISAPETHVEARVSSTDSNVSARIEYEQSSLEVELSLKVRNAPANGTFEVTLNDIALGELTTDSRGRGQIVLSQGDDNLGHLALPDNLLPLTSSTELVIGDILRGQLSRFSSETLGSHHDDNSSNDDSSNNSSNSNSTSRHLVAVFPASGGMTGKVEFESETEGSKLEQKLKIEIEGASPGSVFLVRVGEFTLGEVTVGAKGKAKAIWTNTPSDDELLFPAELSINTDTVIAIGDQTASFK
ncbi:MAG: hypothetical protein KDB03_24570 [Planctomycetales bacterium]|nr:hypothetical protein [Planctomycetales bacterium]